MCYTIKPSRFTLPSNFLSALLNILNVTLKKKTYWECVTTFNEACHLYEKQGQRTCPPSGCSNRVIMAYIYTTVCLQRVISSAWLPKYMSEIQMVDFQVLLIVHTQTLVTGAPQTRWLTNKQLFGDFGQEGLLLMLLGWLSGLLTCQFVAQSFRFNNHPDQYHVMAITICFQAIFFYNYLYADYSFFLFG